MRLRGNEVRCRKPSAHITHAANNVVSRPAYLSVSRISQVIIVDLKNMES